MSDLEKALAEWLHAVKGASTEHFCADCDKMRRERDEALSTLDRITASGEAIGAVADRYQAHAKALAEALRTLTCKEDGAPNTLRDDFPDGGDIVLRWPGNRRDWYDALDALAAYDKDHER